MEHLIASQDIQTFDKIKFSLFLMHDNAGISFNKYKVTSCYFEIGDRKISKNSVLIKQNAIIEEWHGCHYKK